MWQIHQIPGSSFKYLCVYENGPQHTVTMHSGPLPYESVFCNEASIFSVYACHFFASFTFRCSWLTMLLLLFFVFPKSKCSLFLNETKIFSCPCQNNAKKKQNDYNNRCAISGTTYALELQVARGMIFCQQPTA